jgi:hypothetical protein
MSGARVKVVLDKEHVLWHYARTDGSYLSANDPRVLVGLGGGNRVSGIQVQWPDGSIEEWGAQPIDRYLIVKQGSAPTSK